VSEELEKLQRLLERATAAEDATENEPDSEAASLREAWIAFGRLLEAAQPPAEMLLDTWPVPAPKRSYRRFWPAAGVLAASLLICAVAMWALRATSRIENASPSPAQTASTGVTHSTPAKAEQKPAASANAPQWDDSFDEQIAQVGQQVIDMQQNSYAWTDTGGAVQSKIERIQQDIKDNSL
jgi:hypothetical protein